ncbi:hypothetical protein EAI_08590, partial [Harpegnathos saltator]
DVFDATEEKYNLTLDYMAEVLEELEPPVSPNQSINASYARHAQSAFSQPHLPPIQLAPFDSTLTDWEQFRDRFSAIIIENKDLNDFSRMHYLSSCLRGRASECIANLTIAADNFKIAWDAVKARYDNKRRLLSVHMSTLLSLPTLSRESVSDLQSLRGQITVTVAALRNLQRSNDQLWNEIFVHIGSQGSDPVTRKAWNLRTTENSDPSTFDEFERFLASRIRALEEFSSRNKTQPNVKAVSISRVHLATDSPAAKSRCPLCKASHYFNACPIIVRGNSQKRRELVKKHRRCFNCLSANHAAHECKSKYSCRTSSQRHHSLLHAAADFSGGATE